MANISTTDARNLFTKKLVARYADNMKPKAFGRSFFKEVEADTKLISIEVERNAQKIAVDVTRGTEGNRNTWDKSTEKIILPPYYNEYFDMTQLDLYDALYAEPQISAANFGRFLDSANGKLEACMDKIDRAYEKQAWDVLLTGIVTLNKGVNIDFKRNATSLIDANASSTGYWTSGSVDPDAVLLLGSAYLKETGKSEGSVINVIMGESAFQAYKNNTIVKARALQVQWGLESLIPAQRDALGRSYHGQISVGAYTMRIWTYPDFYENAAGTKVKYMDTKKIVMVPEMTSNVLSYAAVPQLLSTGIAPKKGKFLTYDFIDERATAHILGVKSAGVCIPVAVDQIYTAQVVA
ncbi:MAG: hypothetical protein K0S44_226 [Bacteroidetes bacterium]|jgi:hypothetical protein|nr:hypothetical protein [Bacteroidota bacterium]